ncbi:MAG: hypothetical protein H8E55_07310 [Pelagibacterales bacterium]|nr:hypothetical protein [Pelagibacterales bacterium]
MDILEKIIRENCWKFDKGYPDMDIPKDVLLLESIFEDLGFDIKEEVSNRSGTVKAVKKIVDKLGTKYDLFSGKSKPNRLGLVGKKETQFFVDLFQEVFDEEGDGTLDIKITPPRKSPNPSNSFNMYTFDTKEFGEVNIVVSSQPPGGAGKTNESDFLSNINQLISENGGEATVVITSPEYTLEYKNITSALDSSKTGAGKGDKSDAQLLSGKNVEANISLKQDGGFRWASVATQYKDFIAKLVNSALNGQLTDLELKPNPDNPKKYLMYDPKTGNRVTKVIIPDFPKDDIENWVFGPEIPKTIVVSKTWGAEDFSLENGIITAKASHIYKELDDLEDDKIDPVFTIMQHIGMSQGLDYRIIPSKQANISSNARELSYNEIMS